MEAQPASREPSLLDPTENIPNTNTRQITSTSPLPSLSQNPELTSQDQGQDTSRSSSQGANSTASQASQFAYDPRALLNPKATAKRSRTESTQPEDGSTPDPAEDVSGMRSMIERMHGIQRREDQPVKKQKRELADEQDGRKATFAGGGKSTVLGDYMTEQRKEGEKEAGPPPASSAVVDLTADDDDDLVLIKDSGDEEICLGKLEGVFISAFMVPGPKPTGFQGTANAWPALKVSLRRRPASNNILISVSDPCGRDFARVDALGALGLANLMDNKLLNIRLEARLDSRKRTSGESPGSAVSKRMPLNVHLFAPRKHAKNIGRMLSQKQIWLREPTINIGRIPYDNPQAIKAAAPRTQVASGSNGTQSGYGFVARTVEEVRSDVISMFDSLTKSDEIPQMDQPNIIATDLLAHQKQALHFMTSREADDSASDTDKNSLWKLKLRGNGERYFYNIITGQESRSKPAPTRGGILADMMGLGKTLSILSLVATTLGEASHWSKIKPPQTPGAPLIKCNSKATLLICPVSTVANWEEQVKLHVKHKSMSYYIYHGPNRVADVQKLAGFDLVITTYSVVAADHGKPASKTPLAFINWFRIVLDEAHMIRSTATKQSVATCALLAQRRWAVTGTPVQNRLDDLGALIKFLRIKPFDDKGGFTQYILTPFKNADPDILPKLRILVDSITLRRLKDRIDLPPRQDRIVRLNFSPEERKLYRFFAQDTAARMKSITDGRDKLAKNQMGHILRAMGRLRMICAHGSEMLSNEDMKLAEGLSSDNAIELGDDDEEEDRKPSITKEQAYDMLHLLRESDMHHCGICDQTIGSSTGFNPEEADSSDDESEGIKKEREVNIGFMTPCYQIVCPNCLDEFKQRMKKRAEPNYWMTCPLCGTYVPQTLFPLTQADADRDEAARQRVRDNPRLSKQLGRYGGPHTKVKALIEELLKSKAWSDAHPQEPPIKSVVFSGWTSYLDLISIAFEDNALKYTRLDGTMTRRKRTAALDAFRDDPTVQIMLISINAGGLGLNLTTGSKAHVMEPQYNPAAEAQAVDRVHRLGQKREVTITRFVMNDSFEERMLELQAKKKDLADLSMNRNAKLDKEEAAKKRLEALKSLFR